MEYIKKETPSYNLHMIKTSKFKTTSIEIIFNKVLKKDEITKLNFLTSIMTYTTKKYNTKLKFSQKMENLYASRVYASGYRLGRNVNVDFNMKILNDKYSEEGLLDQSFEFLKEIIFNPNVTDDMFDEDSFNIIKNDEISQIERFREDSRRYASFRVLELTDSNEPFSYNPKGSIEDLEKITRKNLYEYYKEFIKCKTIDIFIIGDIDFDKTEKIVKDKFEFTLPKEKEKDPMILWSTHREKRQEVVESDSTNQSKLSISCKLENLTKYERDYVLNIYNLILGGTADSKFFKNIREKYSLCYYINCGANKLDNLLFISSGISKDNYSKIMILIDKEMDDMRKGNFDEDEIEKAKINYLSNLEEIEDSPNQLIALYYAIDKLGSDEIDKKKEIIKKVTKEDIIKLANKVFMDTVYLLGGDKK